MKRIADTHPNKNAAALAPPKPPGLNEEPKNEERSVRRRREADCAFRLQASGGLAVELVGAGVTAKPCAAQRMGQFLEPSDFARDPVEQAPIAPHVFHSGLHVEIEAFQHRAQVSWNVAPFAGANLAAGPVEQREVVLFAHMGQQPRGFDRRRIDFRKGRGVIRKMRIRLDACTPP